MAAANAAATPEQTPTTPGFSGPVTIFALLGVLLLVKKVRKERDRKK